MKINLPFGARKRAMNQEKTETANPNNKQENQMADELKLSSNIEASEQKPLEEDPISKLESELSELKDSHLRLFAEFENYKRRNLKERSELIRSAGSEVIAALLPVVDDFERAVKAMDNSVDTNLKEGILLIQGKLINLLEQRGLKPIQSIGTPFNVDVHEAITNIPVDNEKQKGIVIDELEKGYYLNDKVIRYAKVVVGA